MNEQDIAIRLTGVKKRYKLGQIGGGTLTADLQSWWARLRGKEDPNLPVNMDQRLVGKTFMALNGVDLTVHKGEALGIIGCNGAGKSTLVRCINLLEKPTSGSVVIDGEDLTKASKERLRVIRRKVSMIFQQFNLLAQRNALMNVCYPLEIAGVPIKEAKKRAIELLKLVGLEDRMQNYPAQLSGGQKQRVAIARALATEPKYLLCDEATSALDNESERYIQKSLEELAKDRTTITIAHRLSTIRDADEIIVITEDGIAERGTHEELLDMNGVYAAYYNM